MKREPQISDFELLIVGAGIHGCTVAVRLLHDLPELRSGLRLLDASGGCLAEWERRTRGQGMKVMRSPGAHHLDVPPESLIRHAERELREDELNAPYHRPTLALFLDHSRAVVRRTRLEELVLPETVAVVESTREGYRVHCRSGRVLSTRFLLLAPGTGGQERLPPWAASLGCRASHVEHFDVGRESFDRCRVLVVGGGLSAATVADAVASRGASVVLTSRHRLEARLFDVDPGWMGPKYLRPFWAEHDFATRLRMIREARGRASVTPEMLDRLRRHRLEGRLRLVEGDEVVAVVRQGGALVARVRHAGELPTFDRVLCATGCDPRIEKLRWLGELGAARACEGRPLVGPTLELRPGCFVTGWLAELELGPAARNVSGARRAAERIAGAVRRRLVQREAA